MIYPPPSSCITPSEVTSHASSVDCNETNDGPVSKKVECGSNRKFKCRVRFWNIYYIIINKYQNFPRSESDLGTKAFEMSGTKIVEHPSVSYPSPSLVTSAVPLTVSKINELIPDVPDIKGCWGPDRGEGD